MKNYLHLLPDDIMVKILEFVSDDLEETIIETNLIMINDIKIIIYNDVINTCINDNSFYIIIYNTIQLVNDYFNKFDFIDIILNTFVIDILLNFLIINIDVETGIGYEKYLENITIINDFFGENYEGYINNVRNNLRSGFNKIDHLKKIYYDFFNKIYYSKTFIDLYTSKKRIFKELVQETEYIFENDKIFIDNIIIIYYNYKISKKDIDFLKLKYKKYNNYIDNKYKQYIINLNKIETLIIENK